MNFKCKRKHQHFIPGREYKVEGMSELRGHQLVRMEGEPNPSGQPHKTLIPLIAFFSYFETDMTYKTFLQRFGNV